MRYRVRAVGPAGNVVEAELEAGSEAEARSQAGARGLSVLSLQAATRGARTARGRFPLLRFNQELRALLRAGIPLAEGTQSFRVL